MKFTVVFKDDGKMYVVYDVIYDNGAIKFLIYKNDNFELIDSKSCELFNTNKAVGTCLFE